MDGWLAGWMDGWMDGLMDGLRQHNRYHAIIMRCNLTTNEHVRDYYIDRLPLKGSTASILISHSSSRF